MNIEDHAWGHSFIEQESKEFNIFWSKGRRSVKEAVSHNESSDKCCFCCKLLTLRSIIASYSDKK